MTLIIYYRETDNSSFFTLPFYQGDANVNKMRLNDK